ncbi:MAG: hypothetical protein OQJ83_11255, partial [Altibacter sp.]|nr:hypothetical protein [Altibacter sp.]
LGVNIAEFPETKEAAEAAHRMGDGVILGAPNVMRGGSHNGNVSARLTCSLFHQIVYRYKGFAGCVVFMGGEWHRKKLIKLLKIAKSEGYKTCLYTGEEEVAPEIRTQLDLLKTGRWEAARGGLDSANTNQRFTEVKTNRNLNHLFTKNSMI